ncbi:endonuclease/exonuclease/phosphatase family protein [Salibaculum sp.]|uniref:endonuclease/exonuclease/phosphatase family protein n=1 Tax=Salibaculum sp. TaxID=2855480 RepID=UPI002B4A72B6|nr:endonuclease/exonuclease/phosphatase family protein [Salibaculum sp.]HKL68916.1 endonuclease/exonuclease/phosphatase family protein [Salibaculum sp.]
MRLATYNVEWFDNLFDDQGVLFDDGGWSGRRDITRAQQTAALGLVFQALDADAVMVIEAPDSHRRRDGGRALEHFAERFCLRARKALIGFVNDTQQEIILLHDPDHVTARHDPRESDAVPRFDKSFKLDLDVDRAPEVIRWSKPPLEVALDTKGGRRLRLIGVHAKSKAPHGARTHEEIMRLSIENRRKQLAQCIWLRHRVEEHLGRGDDLVVLGDFNDGPGLDEYEKLFGRSGVEIVLGEDGGVPLFDPHARQVLSQRIAAAPVSARFKVPPDGRFLSVLLDYIMVSQGLREADPHWCIWHPFDDPDCYGNAPLRMALLTASDHFPVTLDFKD